MPLHRDKMFYCSLQLTEEIYYFSMLDYRPSPHCYRKCGTIIIERMFSFYTGNTLRDSQTIALHIVLLQCTYTVTATTLNMYLVSGNGELPGSVVKVFIFLCQFLQLKVRLCSVVIMEPQRPVLVNAIPEDAHCKKERVLIATWVSNSCARDTGVPDHVRWQHTPEVWTTACYMCGGCTLSSPTHSRTD